MQAKKKGPDMQVNKNDLAIVQKIAQRAVVLGRKIGIEVSLIDTEMDIIAANNTCPLKLCALLEADDPNFAHDVFGIARHLDRQTGELTGFFLPRFAV
jgi:hypothetical protein